jgi:fructose-1,6-bisphosphatase class II
MKLSLISLLHDFINVSEKTAISAYEWIGRNNEKAADAAAVSTMRKSLNDIPFIGEIVIGEGERDNAPMLHTGEIVGLHRNDFMDTGSIIQCDIAVDPLEGTTICAHGGIGAISTMVIGLKNTILSAPDVYMNKIAVSNRKACEEKIDLDNSIEHNILNLAAIKKCSVTEITVAILNRPRHAEMISDIINTGARIKLISDCDVTAAIMTCIPHSGIDMYIGIGGAPEGIIAAAAVDMLGGYMQGRLCFDNETQMQNAQRIFRRRFNTENLYKKYNAYEMINMTNNTCNNEIIFVATGITDSALVNGIHITDSLMSVESIYIYKNSKGEVYLRKTQRDTFS